MTEAQLAANRENAMKSTGPRTPEGKKRSSINATRHGLTGQFHAFSEEDQRAFDKHCNALLTEYNPQTHDELMLAISIAEDYWRIHRARAIENNIFAAAASGEIGDSINAPTPEVHTAICHAKVWLEDGQKLQNLTLYESRIRRNIEKNKKELKQSQKDRAEALEIAVEKAKKFARLAEFNGETYQPDIDFPQPEAPITEPTPINRRTFTAVNGFVFSPEEIYRRLDEDRRLAEYEEHEKNGWRRPETIKTMTSDSPKAA